MWFHYLFRDKDGWTYVGGSHTSKSSRDDALERNIRSYPERKFVPYDTESYHEAQFKCRRLNLKNKGRKAFTRKFPKTPIPE